MDSGFWQSALVIGIAWLAGTLPSAWIAVRVLRGEDIRTLGSGNSGATNALRLLGWKAGLPVLAFDFLKGFLPALLCSYPLAIAAGGAAVVGHVFSPWIGFRGGKGVATSAGVLSALFPPLAPFCLAVFACSLLASRRVSVASLSAACAAPVCYFGVNAWTGAEPQIAIAVLILLLPIVVALTHRKNIVRLVAGEEPRLF